VVLVVIVKLAVQYFVEGTHLLPFRCLFSASSYNNLANFLELLLASCAIQPDHPDAVFHLPSPPAAFI